MLFQDQFNRGNNPTPGNNWTVRTLPFPMVDNKIEIAASGYGWQKDTIYRPPAENFADGIIQCDFIFPTALGSGLVILHGRIQGASSDTSYIATCGPNGNIAIWRIVSGSLTQLGINIPLTIGALSSGIKYRLRFIYKGTSLSVRVWNVDDDTELTFTSSNTRTDSSITGSGSHGIGYNSGSTASIQLDNYLAVDDPDVGSKSLVFLDRFDNGLSAWTLDQTGGTVGIGVREYNKRMVLEDTGGAAIVSAVHSFTEPAIPYIVEADMYCSAGAIGKFQLLDSADNVISEVVMNGGTPNGSFDTNNDAPTTFTWSASEYKQIILKVDPVLNTIRCMYTLAGTDGWNWVSAAKSTTAAVVSKIRFITDSVATGEFRVSEVRVFEPWIGAIGDSITAGAPGSGTTGWDPDPASPYVQLPTADGTHPWTYQMSQLFPNQDIWVANFGESGNHIQMVDARMQKVLDLGFKLIIVSVGINDIRGNDNEANMQTEYNSIFTKITNAERSAIITTITPDNSLSAGRNTVKNNINSWLQTRCNALGFSWANTHDIVEGTADLWEPASDSGDGIHPSKYGQFRMAAVITGGLPIGSGPVGSFSGIITDKNGNAIDCSKYNTRVSIIEKNSGLFVDSTLVASADGTWSMSSGNTGTKYIVVYWFEGAYSVTGDVDIAGSEFMTG